MKKTGFLHSLILFGFAALWSAGGLWITICATRIYTSARVVSAARAAVSSEDSGGIYEHFASEKYLIKIGRVSAKTGVVERPVTKPLRMPVEFFSTKFESGGEHYRMWYAAEFYLDSLKRRTAPIAVGWLVWLAAGLFAAHWLNRKLLFDPLDALSLPESAPGRIPKAIEAAARAVFDARSHLALHSVHSSVLLQAAKSISSHVDLNHAVSRILDIVVDKFPDTSCSVTLMDDDGFIRIKNTRGLSAESIKKIKLRRGEGFAGECVETKKTIVVQDTDKTPNAAADKFVAGENIKSFIHVPIVVENRAVGTFNINSHRKEYFTRDILGVAATLSEYLSVAVSNAKLYDRLRDFNRRLESEVSYTTSELLKTNAKLVRKIRSMKSAMEIFGYFESKSSPTEILTKVFTKIRDVVGADFISFVTCDAACGRFKPLFRATGLGDGETAFGRTEYSPAEVPPAAEALAAGRPVIKNSPTADAKWKISPDGVFIKTSAVFPVFAGGTAAGAIILANKIGDGFDDADAEFVGLAAARLGVYIHCVYHCHKKTPVAAKK